MISSSVHLEQDVRFLIKRGKKIIAIEIHLRNKPYRITQKMPVGGHQRLGALRHKSVVNR